MADKDPNLIEPKDLVAAKLAEYNVLKNELHYRADFQNRIMQFHVTALTAIIAAFFLDVNTIPTEAKQLLVYLVPIESFLFGLHYFTQSARIFFIASYLYDVEKYINEKLNDQKLMRWEVELRAREAYSRVWKPYISRKYIGIGNILLVDRPVFWMFDVPALLAMAVTIITVLLSVGANFGWFSIVPPPQGLNYTQLVLLLGVLTLAVSYYSFKSRLSEAQRSYLTVGLWNEVEVLVDTWAKESEGKEGQPPTA